MLLDKAARTDCSVADDDVAAQAVLTGTCHHESQDQDLVSEGSLESSFMTKQYEALFRSQQQELRQRVFGHHIEKVSCQLPLSILLERADGSAVANDVLGPSLLITGQWPMLLRSPDW